MRTRRPTGGSLVIRVEDLADVLALHLVSHGLAVGSIIELLEVELVGGAGGPEAQEIHLLGLKSRDEGIIRLSHHLESTEREHEQEEKKGEERERRKKEN